AKVVRDDGGEQGTRTGAVFGTPRYMAPEQAQGRTEEIGPATDIHALGVILYEMLTARVPYSGDTDLEILNRVIGDEAGSPRRVCPQVPRDLETICLKCLEKHPERRYGSMRELAEDLERFLDGRPIQARRIGLATRAAKWVRRHPRATAAGALTSALSCSLVALLLWMGNRESAYSADLKRASQELDLHKARAEEHDWLARNQEYSVQIRAGGLLKNGGELAKLQGLLLAQKPEPDQKDVRGFEWHYLWRSARGIVQPEDHARVTAIAYSPSG